MDYKESLFIMSYQGSDGIKRGPKSVTKTMIKFRMQRRKELMKELKELSWEIKKLKSAIRVQHDDPISDK